MEFMKIVHMEMNNRHLRPKPGGYFTDKNPLMSTSTGQSPTVNKNPQTNNRVETSENSSSRISPAAELVSERV